MQLNKASDKINEMEKKQITNYDLVGALQDDQNDQFHVERQPLYREYFKDWPQLDPSYIVRTKDEKKQKRQATSMNLLRRSEDVNQKNKKKAKQALCFNYYEPQRLLVFALGSDIAIYQVLQGQHQQMF